MLEQLIPNILLIVAAIEAIVFAFSYATFFNWRKNSAGRAIMAFVIGLIVVFIINTLGVFLGANYPNHEYPGRVFIRTIGYSYLVGSLAYLIYVLWSNWHRGDNDEALVEPKQRIKD